MAGAAVYCHQIAKQTRRRNDHAQRFICHRPNKAQAICQFFRVPFVELDGGSIEQPDDGWYQVQVGAFKQKGNAERLRDELVGKGYEAIIV